MKEEEEEEEEEEKEENICVQQSETYWGRHKVEHFMWSNLHDIMLPEHQKC